MGTKKIKKTSPTSTGKQAFRSSEYVNSSDDDSGAHVSTPIPAPVTSNSTHKSSKKSKSTKTTNAVAATPIPLPTTSTKPLSSSNSHTNPSSKLNLNGAKGAKRVQQSRDSESLLSDAQEITEEQDDNGNAKDSSVSAEDDTTRISKTPYKPPVGFESVRPDEVRLYDSVNALSDANLNGKKLLHIIAPAKLSATDIEGLDIKSALGSKQGLAVISHEGVKYNVLQNDDQVCKETRILVPKGSSFVPVRTTVSSTLQLRQMIDLPNPTTSYEIPSAKPLRQQPKGLRMRFRISGQDQDHNSVSDWSDEENATSISHQETRAEGDVIAKASHKKTKQKDGTSGNSKDKDKDRTTDGKKRKKGEHDDERKKKKKKKEA